MGPKNLRSATWYLKQVRIRTLDHFPVITRVLALLHDRLVNAAAEIKATTTSAYLMRSDGWRLMQPNVGTP